MMMVNIRKLLQGARLRYARIALASLVAIAGCGKSDVGERVGAQAQAVHDLGLFELDRNAVNAAAVPGEDWDNIFNNTTVALQHSFIDDSASNDTTEATSGPTKDTNDLNQWTIGSSGVPGKNDITHAYAADYVNPANSHQIIYFGLDRFANNGAAQVGFWFFRNSIGISGGRLTGTHAVGDVLIQSNFTQGGAVTLIQVFAWVGSGGSNGALNLIASGVDCATAPAGDSVCATVNTGTPTATSPWPYTPKSGPSGTFPSGSFFEGGVDLTALGLSNCFSTFLGETRSSPATDSSLQDFAGPTSFDTCGITVTKACTATLTNNGSSVHFGITGTVCNGSPQSATNLTLSDVFTGPPPTPGPTLTPVSTSLGPQGSATECTNYSGAYDSTTTGSNDDTATATVSFGSNQTSGSARAQCSVNFLANMTVSKTCTTAVSGGVITVSFSGQVCNTGSVQLTGVTVTDSDGTVTSPPSSTLNPGACSNYSGSYTTTDPTNISDTVTATATGALGTGTLTRTATATCNATINPAITISKNCTNLLVADAGGHLEVKVHISGTITNTGNVNLQGITVTDSDAGNVTLSQTTLAVGGSFTYGADYFPSLSSLSGNTGLASDTVTVSATSVISGGGNATSQADASCALCPLPIP